MFDFQKLEVYNKAKTFNKTVSILIQNNSFDRVTHDQLRRASFSIMLNIAEGTARLSNRDRRNFFTISRGSVFECAAILEYLTDTGSLEKKEYNIYYQLLEEISKMLFALIKKLEK